MLKYESICKPNKQISIFSDLVNTASFKGKSAASSHERLDGQTLEDYLVKACRLLGDTGDGDIEKKMDIKQKGFQVYSQYTIALARFLVKNYGPYNNGGNDIQSSESIYIKDSFVAPDLLLKAKGALQGAVVEIKTTFNENNKNSGQNFLQCLDQFLTFKGDRNTYALGLLVYITAAHGKPFHTTIFEFDKQRAKTVIECILYAKAFNALKIKTPFWVNKPPALKDLIKGKKLAKLKEEFEKQSNKITKLVLNMRVNTRLEIPFQDWWMRIRRELDKFEKYFKIGDKVKVKYPTRYYDGEITESTKSFVRIYFEDSNEYITLEEQDYGLVSLRE